MPSRSMRNSSDFADSKDARDLNSHKKRVRVFQTFMTNEELADRNIAVTSFGLRDEVRRWFAVEADDQLNTFPMLHAVNISQGLMEVEPWAKNDGLRGVRAQKLISQVNERIENLKKAALEENVEISQESMNESIRFLDEIDFNLMPSVFVAANGNIRFVWEVESGERVAFQVRATNREVQYVIFKLNQDGGFDHHMGLMKFSSVVPFLQGLEMFYILFRESTDAWQKVLRRTSKSFGMSAV